jgi:flagellar protein FlbD
VITITRLDGAQMLLNSDLIESVERTPDTLVSLSNGDTLIVRESPDELVARVIRFKRAVLEGVSGSGARRGLPWQ